MENKFSNLKAGDKVYVIRSSSWDANFLASTVTNVTPKGFMDVKIGTNPDAVPTRFRPDGEELGGDRYRCYTLDSMPFEERSAEIAKEGRAKHAAGLIRDVKLAGEVRHSWGKEALQKAVEELAVKLEAARAAVEAI